MEKKTLISKLSAICLALSFGIFLLYRSLSSSDFIATKKMLLIK